VTETALAIAREHPAYTGHFPGRPILPAVVILAEVLAAIDAAVPGSAAGLSVANAKFLKAVTPGTPLVLAHAQAPDGSVRFEVRSPADLVASGRLMRAAAE
jgi:3-hydroxymyristoyl/3-hydroxydecanoyl-(acyl carrier protein) dehydratase